jgi:hypothetical protein
MRCLPCWCALLVAAGCGDGDPRLAVSGNVKFKGSLLDQGRIEFHPPDGRGTLQGAPIDNGRYDIPRKNGLLPGTYIVRVFSYDVKGLKVFDPIPGDPGAQQFRERISKKFNVASVLRADVAPGSTSFDFAVD